jgi:hypothetical protein
VDKDKLIEGYDSTREGGKGAKPIYSILFTHLGISWEKWLHELLGEATWCIVGMHILTILFCCWGILGHSLSFWFLVFSWE